MDKNKKEAVKDTYQSFSKILVTFIIILIAVISSYITFFVLQASLKTPTPVVVVISPSMSPTINEGDLLFVQGTDPSEISNGSVIVFQANWIDAPAEPVVHRVIDIQELGGQLIFFTKGDNNEYADSGFRYEDEIYGVVIGGIPYIGWVKIFFDRTGLLIPLIIFIIFILVISMVWDYIKEREEQKKKEIKEKFFEFKKDSDQLE